MEAYACSGNRRGKSGQVCIAADGEEGRDMRPDMAITEVLQREVVLQYGMEESKKQLVRFFSWKRAVPGKERSYRKEFNLD